MSAPAGRRVAVIGGGWSGLACAVTLSEAGCRVTLFEASTTLGGRARRVDWHGAAIDNGQHLLLGAYRSTLELIHRVQPGAQAATLYERSPLCLAGPGAFRLRAAPLPAPWHTLVGLFDASDCTWSERARVARAFLGWRRMRWRCDPAMSVETLLHDQPPRMIARLWRPICLAALNTPPGAASAQVYLNVLRDSLAGRRADSDLIIPRVDLSLLFPEPAAQHIARQGGTILTRTMVECIEPRAGGVDVRLRHEARPAAFDSVVIATAPWQASRLLETVPAAKPVQQMLDAYTYLPICTINVRLDRRIGLDPPMLQLDGDGPGQWVFDRTPHAATGSRLAFVISADGPHRHLSQSRLVAAVLAQLRRQLRSKSGVDAIESFVITEKRATFACLPGRMHPSAGEIASNVFLAGDHTDPDYPATLEAAVRSGLRAARALLDEAPAHS